MSGTATVLMVGAMAMLMLAGTVTLAFASNSREINHASALSAHHEEVSASETEQARISWGLPYTEASAAAIPKEEAKQIGVNALAEFFGADLSQLGKYVLEIGYNPQMDPLEFLDSPTGEWDEDLGMFVEDGTVRDSMPDALFPMNVHRSAWVGSIIFNNDRIPCPEGRMLRSHDTFRFRVDAQTGELLGLQFFPSARSTTNDAFASAMKVFDYAHSMTAQHNIEYARYAMQFAEESNLFENEVHRAVVIGGGWMLGRDDSFELRVAVVVKCAGGEAVVLQFQGRERKELVDVDFITRTIDYAVNRDGSVTDPVSRFVGNPDSLFDFGWVHR